MSESRSARLSRAFRDVKLIVAGREFRAPTAGSIDLLQQIGSPLFAAEGDETPVDGSSLIPLFEFIWIHTAPIEDVMAAAESKNAIRLHARRLAFETSVDDVPEFTEAFRKLQELLQAAMVEVVPEGSEGKPVPSPIGSLSSSSPSGQPGILSGSDISSGSVPSGERSPIFTPLSDITDPFADGPASSTTATAIPLPDLPLLSKDGADG